MKFPKIPLSLTKVNKLFDNIYLLYLVSFLAIVNILGYIVRNSAYSVIFFAVVTFIMYYFVPHWSVALVVAILLTNIFVPGQRRQIKRHKEGMKNKEEKELEDAAPVNKNPRVDYASTVEGAYKDLSKILGSEGIKNLTSDTKQLMGQQMELAKAMEGMAPLLQSAKSMLDGFDLKSLGGLSDIAKQLGTN